jgi:hypothetical protein
MHELLKAQQSAKDAAARTSASLKELALTQLEIMRASANEYREQVTRIFKITEGRTGGGGDQAEREQKGSEIARFWGEARKELREWKVQLPLKIAGKPRTFDTEQKKQRYAVGRLEKVALEQIIPYWHEISGEVKLDSFKTLVYMLELAFQDQNKAATTKRELLRLKQRDCEFSQCYVKFQRYVAQVKWNAEAQMDTLRNGLSNELKDFFFFNMLT